MSNAFCIAWRIPCVGIRAPTLLQSNSRISVRTWCAIQRATPNASIWRPYSYRTPSCAPSEIANGVIRYRNVSRTKRTLPFTPRRSIFGKSSYEPDPATYSPVAVRRKPFSKIEIERIFGKGKISPTLGNELLAHLHGRRVAGTPDVDLPLKITQSVSKATINAGLSWLQTNHPVDEDAAILARLEREERQLEEKLIRRAEDLGLYKPQSGAYDKELGEGQDVHGKSILKEVREKNEAYLLAEQERKRKEWLEGEHKDREKLAQLRQKLQNHTALQKFEESAVVESRPRADPSQRPLLAWIQKHHLEAMNENAEIFSSMTTSRRILPSVAVAVITICLGYIFAQNYEPPARQDRMWPSVPPAAATVMSLISINVGVFMLWKFPPAWKLLNRYFLSVAAYPYALSVVGSVFSHQAFKHLATNMVILWFLGTRLHDEIGRGNFLDVYLASGVVGSVTSLVAHVLQGKLQTTALGASGALAGVVAAWLTLHAHDKITIFFLPREWQEKISASGWIFLTNLVIFELVGLFSPIKFLRLDYFAHLGGYFAGTVWALSRMKSPTPPSGSGSGYEKRKGG